MNEDYLDKLYGWISSQDNTFQNDVSVDQFKQKMQDNTYAKKMHDWISSIDNTFNTDIPFDAFLNKVRQQPAAPKKKEGFGGVLSQPLEAVQEAEQLVQQESVSPSDQSSSVSPSTDGKFIVNPLQKAQEAIKTIEDEQAKNKGISLAPEGTFLRETQKKELLSEPISVPLETPSELEKRKYEAAKERTQEELVSEEFYKKITPKGIYEATKKAGEEIRKREEETPEFIRESVNAIDENFLDRKPRTIISDLNRQYEGTGFDFSGQIFDDNLVKVTAPNGKSLSLNVGYFQDKEAEALKLKNFIKENSTSIEGGNKLQKEYEEGKQKFLTEKQIDDAMKTYSVDAQDFGKRKLKYDENTKSLKESIDQLNSVPESQRNNPEFISKKNEIDRLIKETQKESDNLKDIQQGLLNREYNLKKSVGEYTKFKENQGGWAGGIWNSISKTIAQLPSQIYGLTSDIITEGTSAKTLLGQEEYEKQFLQLARDKYNIKSDDFKSLMRNDELTEQKYNLIINELKDRVKKERKYGKEGEIGMVPYIRETVYNLLKDKNTTEQWQELANKSTIGQAVLGLAGSLPNMLMPGGWIGRGISTFISGSGGIMEEMEKDPDFKDVSENEKWLVAAPIGMAVAGLEEAGLSSVLKGTNLTKYITAKILLKAPINATPKVFKNILGEEVQDLISKGVLRPVSGFLAEAETGSLQTLAEYTTKDIYNILKDKRDENGNYVKMFDTPDTVTEWLTDIIYSGAVEGIGGAMMTMPMIAADALTKDNFKSMDDITFEAFVNSASDINIEKAFISNLKGKIASGEMTMSDGKDLLNKYRNAKGLLNSLTDDLSIADKKVALDLLNERKKLEQKKLGKDDALAKPIQDRIDAINKQLTKISEDAIQKQTAGEVPVQPEARVGEEVVQGEPKAEPQVTPGQGVISPEEKEKITKNRRVDLFPEESEFADAIGGSGRNSNLSDYNEVNGIGIASYTNPDNGLVDVIMSGTSDNDYVGYVRVYENGKPTNRWTSKMSNESGNKQNFKTMISEVQSRLPENHEYTETTNISIDGVRVYSNQLDRGYEILTDENGNPVTNTVTLNAATVQGLQEATTQEEKQSLYDNMIVTTREQFNELKDKITSLMPNVRVLWNQANNTVQLQLPVLVQSTKTKKEPTTVAEEVAVTEVAPVQFTEQDRARQQELTDALAKADKRRKNMIVGETTMSKTEAKAELDALNQKEQAAQQSAPEVAPTERTPEQEADLLEELLTGKKKEPVAEEVAPEEKPKGKKLAEAIRKNLKIKGPQGLQSNILGIPIGIWNAGVDTIAAAIEAGSAVADAVESVMVELRKWHKESKSKRKLDENSIGKKMLIQYYAEAIKTAREAGTSNEGIKLYLERKGATEEQIDALLKYKERGEKKAPTAEKVVGKSKPKKVTVNEMTALKDQIRLEAKAAREAKGDLNTKRKQLAAAINAMAKSGVISVRQAEIIIRRVNTVNLDNPDMVERLLDYADKVFKDAEYASKLKNAKKLQSEAKSLSKNKEKNAEVRELAKEFGKIDPSMVDNIDEYIEMTSEVVEGVKGSRLTAKGVSLASAVDINKTKKYIDKALENQVEKQREMMAAKMQDLMGVDVSDLTYDQMIELLDNDKPIDKYKEGIIRDTISRMFDTYSAIIESMFKTGKNPFDISEDAETVEFKDSQKELVRNFMSMDLNSLTPREALMAVDALNNFIVNGSTANMETVYRNYLGTKNAKTVKDKGIKGKPLSFLFIKSLGRFFLEEFVSLPLLIESMFKSQSTALYFSKMMGLNDLTNSASQATSITQKAVSNYLKQFSSLTPNKKAFNDAYNATERGMLAFMTRNIIGTESEMKKEFDYRKKLIEESIKELSEGSTKEQEKAKLYQEAYDKILKDSKDAQEVKQKTDKINADAVDWWINEWSKHYNDMSDVALNVYNKVLEKDLNYTTDRYARLEMAPKDKSELESNVSAYFFNNGTMYKKEAGALKETVDKTGELPKNKDGEVTRYVDLSFDSVQASSLYDAMSDIKTAGAIRQVESFLKSKDLKKVFSPEDLKLLTDRVNLAIRNIRSQVNYDSSELNKLVKNLDRFAKFSATLALAGVTQPFKQTIPLMFNTLINAGSIDPVSILTNKDLREFINNSGRAIANRGVESQVYIESINRLIDQAAKSNPEKAAQFIEKANDLWMKIFLANPDAYIAKASWMAYYEQSLKKQKINTKGINYATHKLNEEAADYAQMMVDRQQNITDTRLAGAMYSDTKGGAYKKLITRLFLPLASFRLNQYFRTKSDLATLFSRSNTVQDKAKAVRSLTGLAVEQLIFKSLVIGFGLTYHYISDAIIAAFTGDEEDEEEKEKKWKIRQDNLFKGQATSAVTDLFSPLPAFDPLVKYGANTALDVTQELLDVADENKLSIFVDDPKKIKTYSDAMGMYGIGIDKVLEILKTGDLAFSGEYTDNYDNKKFITEEQQTLLKWSLIPSIILNTGVLPGAPEFNNIMGKVKKDIMYSGKTKNQLEESAAFRDYGSRKEFKKAEPQEYLKAKNTPGDPLYELDKKEKEARDKKKEEEGVTPKGSVGIGGGVGSGVGGGIKGGVK